MSANVTNVQLFNILKEYGVHGKDIKRYMKAIGKWPESKTIKKSKNQNCTNKTTLII